MTEKWLNPEEDLAQSHREMEAELVAAEAERDRLAGGVAEAEKALDWADAPITDEHLAGLAAVLGQPDTGYTLAGRIRALFSRERIDANRLRGRVMELEKRLVEWEEQEENRATCCVENEDRLQQATEALTRFEAGVRGARTDSHIDRSWALRQVREALAALAGEDDGKR